MTTSQVTTLYLRGVPRLLVREAKAAAAREGKTLGRWVSERLAEATGPSSDTETDSLRAEMDWLEKNRTVVERRYRGQYVAIVNQGVVDHDPEFDPLARRMFAKFGARPVYMPKLGRREIRLRSPRRSP